MAKKRARRGRGEGSVYLRGDGLWCGVVTVGHSPSGRRKRRTVYARTKTAVLAKMKQEAADAAKGLERTSTKGTVGELLLKWLEFTATRVQPKTHARYKVSVDAYLMPLLGSVQLSRLTTEVIDIAMGKIVAGGKTAANPFAALRQACNQARRWKLLPSNPCEDVTLPRHDPKSITPLTKEQTIALLRASQGHRLHGLFVLLLTTGCRIGEALAVHWCDVDLEGCRLQIRQTLEELAGKVRLKTPKTKASQRVVLLPGVTATALQAHRERMLAEGLDTPHVFADTIGGFLRASNVLRRDWKPMCKSAGVPVVRIHDARHSVATLLVAGGAPIKAVQGLLGHSSPAITLELYSKFSSELQTETASRMETMLNGYKMATDAKVTVISESADSPQVPDVKRIE